MIESSDLAWRKTIRGFSLHLHGRGPALLAIVPDGTHPGMWRIRIGRRLSDMVNASRALDAGIATALGALNGGNRYREMPAEPPPARKSGPAYADIAERLGERASRGAVS
jgi:hypothetical protein